MYRENLPTGCPPIDAEDVDNEIVVYRIVHDKPPSDADFESHSAKFPEKTYADACKARGVSVFKNPSDIERLKLLSTNKNKPCLTCQIKLKAGAGKIKQTGTPSHHTWWPLKDFQILQCCEVVE